MARREYTREDFAIAVGRDDDATVLTTAWGKDRRTERHAIDPAIAEAWARDGLPPDLGLLGPSLAEWLADAPPADVQRVTIDVADPMLAGLGWEAAVARELAGRSWIHLVRVTRARPRATTIGLTVPIRIVEVNPAQGPRLRDVVYPVFGNRSAEAIEWAFVVREMPLDALTSLSSQEWPTLDVLHVTSLPLLDRPDAALSTASGAQGSLGWLARMTERLQTRLVVLHAEDGAQAITAQRLGLGLARRGGPAVVILPATAAASAGVHQRLYWNIVHDVPLDLGLPGLDANSQAGGGGTTLYAGAGREDALRLSEVGVSLVELRRQLTVPQAGATALRVYFADVVRRGGSAVQLKVDLDRFEADWNSWRFEFHEREGALPMSEAVHRLRTDAGAQRPIASTKLPRIRVAAVPKLPAAPRHRTRRNAVSPVRPAPEADAREARYLTASFWREGDARTVTRLDAHERLRRGEVYQLGVQITPDGDVQYTFGRVPILEEIFKWDTATEGAWVQVGLTGLDFEVLSAPLQEIWLPRIGPSELVYVPVRTAATSAARLRIVLYYRHQVIQSLRVAAIVADAAGEALADAAAANALGAALSLRAEDCPRLRGLGHARRVEYSLGLSPADVETRPERALSIVANDLDGVPVVTVNGPELFETRTNNDLPKRVLDVRAALTRVAFPPIPGVPASQALYAFGAGGQRNAGTEAQFKAALRELAIAGWRLYDAIFRRDTRQRLAAVLSGSDKTIHVAHVLLEKAIPWAVVYDRQIDPGMRVDAQGAAVAHDTCLAALAPDGTLRETTCGTHPECLLHPSHIDRCRRAGQPVPDPASIACPLPFWGFRHIAEMPPQQVGPTQAAIPGQRTTIRVSGTAHLLAGLNLGLATAAQHAQELDALLVAGVTATWKAKASTRDAIIQHLKDQELDLVYFYCHARGGIADPAADPPYLEFEDTATRRVEQITSDALDADPWTHSPLVMLNGCGTAGFSPDALSPFVIKLVQDRGAAGVVGTEIPVSEGLAAETAITFLSAVLSGQQAGPALLATRRSLLAKRNPLGLVYVLYGPADLELVRT